MFSGTSGRKVKYLILSCSKGVVAHFNLVTQRNKVRALAGIESSRKHFRTERSTKVLSRDPTYGHGIITMYFINLSHSTEDPTR